MNRVQSGGDSPVTIWVTEIQEESLIDVGSRNSKRSSQFQSGATVSIKVTYKHEALS